MKPPSELVKMGIVAKDTIWKCKRACYGLKEAPKMWEEHRDALLHQLEWKDGNDNYYLSQSQVHPSLWYIMKGKWQIGKKPQDEPVQKLDDRQHKIGSKANA